MSNYSIPEQDYPKKSKFATAYAVTLALLFFVGFAIIGFGIYKVTSDRFTPHPKIIPETGSTANDSLEAGK